MSYGHAFRCDKCGYQTDLGSAPHPQSHIGTPPAPDGWSVILLRITTGHVEDASGYLHLCRNCTDDLGAWLK